MSNVYAIDLPSLCQPRQYGVDDILVLRVLDGLKEIKSSSLLFRNDLWSFVDFQSRWGSGSFCMALAGVKSLLDYDGTVACENLTICPDISEVADANLKKAINLQCSYFHRKGIYLFVTFPSRWSGNNNKLTTTCDRRHKEHNVNVVADENCWEKYVASKKPFLNQAKHMQDGYVRSGKSVAPFTSYNPRNEEPARRLLFQAYADYQGEEEFPKHLYTWDSAAMVYVKFNNSGSNEYHGYDLSKPEYSEIPNCIREIYHH